MRTYLLPVLCLCLPGVMLAQEAPPGGVGAAMMEYYLEQHDFVAEGSFSSWPDEERDILETKEMTLQFVPVRIFKTPEEVSGAGITIRTTSDMLVYPGEDISRFAKKDETLRKVSAELDAVRTRIQELYEQRQRGRIGQADYETEVGALYPRYYTLIVERGEAMAARGTVGVIDGVTFYDLGGAIRPGERYLLFANRNEHGQYALDPAGFASYIYWGERKEVFADMLNKMADGKE